MSTLYQTVRQKTLTVGGGFALLDKILPIRKSHQGGILIEFTFAVPVCIALLLFVHDHYRYYELKNKIQSSAYLAASMLQNITNTGANRQLHYYDLTGIAYASGLNFFHTDSMFKPWPLGVRWRVFF